MNRHIGTTLDSLFEDLDELAEVNLRAQKKVLALALRERMAQLHLSKASLARLMRTSRAHVDRLLDPGNTSVTLLTLARASGSLGLKLQVALLPARAKTIAGHRVRTPKDARR
jgi:antitoxin HicB